MTILFFGDVMGKVGRQAVAKFLPDLKARFHPDLVLANVENLAHGTGVTLKTIEDIFAIGVDFCTSGNHVFDKPEARAVFEKYPEQVIRPANFSDELPGKGTAVIPVRGEEVMVINLNGQVFMENQFDFGAVSNPFVAIDLILQRAESAAKIKILDFHAEATSEKRAMGLWLDGRVSAVLGSHTHVATADARILPQGTGYQTDLGMVGAADSVIGVEKDGAIKRLLADPQSDQKIPLKVAEQGPYEASYVMLEIDDSTGKCQNIKGYFTRGNETNHNSDPGPA